MIDAEIDAATMAKKTNMWQTLTEEEIREGSKRILEFYPLGNVPLRSLFPVLQRCATVASGWKRCSCRKKDRDEERRRRRERNEKENERRRSQSGAPRESVVNMEELERAMKR